ncbi:tRNA threonylcarbamoyladenosine biosynthesis protein RimN [Marinomonas agarivorans]|nr:tRNA threonylcarbamoyladenosine biosynthesis protein RimN [Marinomonas agarivorans]
MIISQDPNAIADVLRNGGIIAYPTEAVWGLGCDPFNEEAVKKLLTLKSRPIEKGMILVAGTAQQLQPWCAELPDELAQKLLTPCQSPTTWLVEDEHIAPTWIRGKFTSTAIRLSQHEGVQALCQAFGGVIVSTSANPSEQEPARTLPEVQAYFSEQIDGIFLGELGAATQPSQIKNLRDDSLIRL